MTIAFASYVIRSLRWTFALRVIGLAPGLLREGARTGGPFLVGRYGKRLDASASARRDRIGPDLECRGDTAISRGACSI
jgi:hypothetical protein